MGNFLIWPLKVVGTSPSRLPKRLLTRKPFDADGALDSLTALLLPGDQIVPSSGEWLLPLSEGDAIGLWMGTNLPFPNFQSSSEPSSFWVCNFPATGLYDANFTQSLSEVGLGPEQEGRTLSTFKSAGYSIVLTITPEQSLADLSKISPDALLIVLRSAADIEQLREKFLDEIHTVFGSETPLILHGGPEGHLPSSPSALGIHAVLGMPVSA